MKTKSTTTTNDLRDLAASLIAKRTDEKKVDLRLKTGIQAGCND